MDIKLLHTTSTLSGNAVVINSVFTAEYSLYGFTFSGAKGDGGQFTMRFHEGGTPATGASDYSRFRRVGTNSTEWVDDHETGTDAIRLGWVALATTTSINGFGFIYDTQTSNRETTMFVKGVTGSTSAVYNSYNGGRLLKNSVVDGLTLNAGASNSFTGGKFSIYGYK